MSLGAFRMPEKFFKNMVKLYPDEKLFASTLQTEAGMTSYPLDLEKEMQASETEM